MNIVMNLIENELQRARTLNGNELLIIDAALYTFLKFGYQGTTMKMIADRAGTGKAAVHYYFRSKDKLFEMAFCRYIRILLDFIKNNAPEEMEISFEDRMLEYPEIYSIAWFVANEFQTNSKLAFEIMNRNDDLRDEFNAVYKSHHLQEKFERLIRLNLNVIIQKCRVRIEV
jgi:AcrR family transcriptional regulator